MLLTGVFCGQLLDWQDDAAVYFIKMAEAWPLAVRLTECDEGCQRNILPGLPLSQEAAGGTPQWNPSLGTSPYPTGREVRKIINSKMIFHGIC